jgi:hypothetical protein
MKTDALPDSAEALFVHDIQEDPSLAPQVRDPKRVPNLMIYLRGTTNGKPDIITPHTEAYIIRWEEKTPWWLEAENEE